MTGTSYLLYPVRAAPVIATRAQWSIAGAGAINVDMPSQSQPGGMTWVTGTVRTLPQALEWSLDQVNWYPALALSIDALGNFSFPITSSLIPGQYTIWVRDYNFPILKSAIGPVIVSAFNPSGLSSGTPLWITDTNDPNLVMLNADGFVASIINRVNPRQSLSASLSVPYGARILWNRSSGSRPFTFYAKQAAVGSYDQFSNFLDGNPLHDQNIISAFTESPDTANSWTVVQAVWIGGSGSVFNGLQLSSSPPRPYSGAGIGQFRIGLDSIGTSDRFTCISTVRLLNGGSPTATIRNAANQSISASVPYPGLGWIVFVTIKNGNTLTLLSCQQSQATISSGPVIIPPGSLLPLNHLTFGADMSDGHSLNGAAFPMFSAFQIYKGALTGADLNGAITMVGSSAQLNHLNGN